MMFEISGFEGTGTLQRRASSLISHGGAGDNPSSAREHSGLMSWQQGSFKRVSLISIPMLKETSGTKGSSSHRLARTSSCLECWQQVMCFSIFLTFKATKYNRYVIRISRLASSSCLLSSECIEDATCQVY
ncbi:hypothetical protein HanRHA438_Chr12g0537331 [Helianthus annuus]|nr:hypothetical protein HanOQP8_Chr12g0433631 [Helianthus annuus]KAJ0865137.1 hypothetical protein HanRHA438_Chr12g0537331 [Helianthus annuus]